MNSMHPFSLFVCLLLLASCQPTESSYTTWEEYGGSSDNIRYSSLAQVDTHNVMHLKKVWEYRTGDADAFTQIQTNTIIVGNMLYGVSPKLKLFALDAATGVQQWVFDPYAIDPVKATGVGYFAQNVCRGVTYYSDAQGRRLFYGAGSGLFCVDADTGKPVEGFAKGGRLDLHNDLGRDVSRLSIAMTSPGIIYRDLIIIGSRVNEEAAAAPGYIRAYDVHTGALRWTFHTIPKPGEEGYETWDDKEAWKHIGGANAWAGFSLDEKRGIVYAPLGSASYDFYGGLRKGDNLYANSIVALDAATGKRIWHFQTVHHDVWDRDLPTAPALVTVQKDGKAIDALAQPTKTGWVYLLDRTNGTPLFPVDEISVPVETDLKGEVLAPTQPWPRGVQPFVRQTFTDRDINPHISPEEQVAIKKKLAALKTGRVFHPPSTQGTVIFPGFDGGAEWGGPAYDPQSGLLYVNANEMPWVLTMVEQSTDISDNETLLEAGRRLYDTNCMACHGPERQGGGNYPGIADAGKRYTEASFTELLRNGRRMMSAFAHLTPGETEALATFVLGLDTKASAVYAEAITSKNPYWQVPYTSTGYNKFLTKDGYPAIAPPWGTLNAIHVSSGKLVWQVPLGETPALAKKGIHTGTENYGGPVVTAGGLVFIAAARDGKLRAFHKRTGALLWQADLPYSGFATPSVYEIDGRQYIVIACGGGKLGTPSGDVYAAFSLDEPALQ